MTTDDSAVTVWGALRHAATARPRAEAVVVGARDEVMSWSELADRAAAFSDVLAGAGVGTGERVVLAMENSCAWLVVACAAAKLGAVVVPVSTRMVDREVRDYLDVVRPGLIVMQQVVRGRDVTADWARSLAPFDESRSIMLRDGADLVSVHGAPRVHSDTSATDDTRPPAGTLVMIGTSGTTGKPKAAALGDREVMQVARGVAQRQQLTPDDRFFSVAPFTHTSGLVHGFLCCLVSGATLHTAARFELAGALEVLRTEDITVYHGMLLPEVMDGFRRPGRVRAWTAGPSALLASTEARTGVRLCSLYGLTETGGCSTIARADDPAEIRHNSNGAPLPGTEVRVVDPVSGQQLAAGVLGEVHLRTPCLMLGYYRNEAATSAAIDPDTGWFRTGDIGEITPDGQLRFHHRLKDVLRTNGENYSAQEVEDELRKHPAIAEVAVVALPDERRGEVAAAVVVAVEGTELDRAEFDAFCAERLSDFKRPRALVVVPELPRTDTLKVQKHRLREYFPEIDLTGPDTPATRDLERHG